MRQHVLFFVWALRYNWNVACVIDPLSRPNFQKYEIMGCQESSEVAISIVAVSIF